MPPDVRDEVVDFVHDWSRKTGILYEVIIAELGLYKSKFHNWEKRYGRVNIHNSTVPRDFWIQSWEREAILEFHSRYPLEGYRRLAFMMNDADVVAVSPSTVYRTLKAAGLMAQKDCRPSRKGTGFQQPGLPHQHWHIDVAYINIAGTFYYLCMVLDGCSRYLVSWDLRPQMTERDIEIIIQKGLEAFPGEKPRIISDNGPQFISRDFREFVRQTSMTHVKTSPFYPQSNGKLEALNKTVKKEVIRPANPRTLREAKEQIASWVDHYNNVRLHSSIDWVTPKDQLEGRASDILQRRDGRLEKAREDRKKSASTKMSKNHNKIEAAENSGEEIMLIS